LARRHRVHVHDIELAGARARLRLAGDILADQLTETFSHLRAAPGSSTPDLRIEAWAEDETGEPGLHREPAAPDPVEVAIDGGRVAISGDERFLDYRVGDNSVAWLDRATSRIVASVRRTGDMLLRERVKPFGALLPVWLRDRGVRVMHAAAVGDGVRAVLLPGLPGAGKSTCATFCVEAGLFYLGDDAIGLQETEGDGFIAHSLYGAARLWPKDAEFFPDWSRRAVHPHGSGDEPKLLFYVGRRHQQRLAPRAQIAAIAFPEVKQHGEPRLRRLSRAQALRALVVTSLFLSVKPEPADMDHLARLVNALPAFALELGGDRSRIADLVDQCLRSAAASRGGGRS
jgi:hypothetical protein